MFNRVCFEGVLSQKADGNITKFGRQYVAATYVKFIESAGGRMVPILYPLVILLWNFSKGFLFSS